MIVFYVYIQRLMRFRIHSFKSPSNFIYWPFQGDTSDVVLFVLCTGVECLCCLDLLYVFIYILLSLSN